MNKKLLCSIICLLSVCFSLKAVPAFIGQEMPQEFYVKEHFLSWTRTFDIETKEYKLGTVHRKLLSLALQYDFYDVNELLQAKARMRFFSWGITFDVTDANDAPMGTIQQRIFKLLPTFTIVSPTGEIQAEAKLNFWGTKYSIKTPASGDEVVATLSRPFFRCLDNWKVKILKPEAIKNIDTRLFVLVMASQTDRDYWARQRATQQNNYVVKGVRAPTDKKKAKAYKKRLTRVRDRVNAFREQHKDIKPGKKDIQHLEEMMVNSDLDDKELLELLESGKLTAEEQAALSRALNKTIDQKLKSLA